MARTLRPGPGNVPTPLVPSALSITLVAHRHQRTAAYDEAREKSRRAPALSHSGKEIVQSFRIHSTISLRSLSDTLSDAWTGAAFIAATASPCDLPLNFFATSL